MPSAPIYKNDTNTIDDIMANDIVQVSLKLRKTGITYAIQEQTISVLREGEIILDPTLIPIKAPTINKEKKDGGGNQYQHIKGGLRRFSNSNRVNNRVIYNRTMSRRD